MGGDIKGKAIVELYYQNSTLWLVRSGREEWRNFPRIGQDWELDMYFLGASQKGPNIAC